jgi:hypothetical protein
VIDAGAKPGSPPDGITNPSISFAAHDQTVPSGAGLIAMDILGGGLVGRPAQKIGKLFDVADILAATPDQWGDGNSPPQIASAATVIASSSGWSFHPLSQSGSSKFPTAHR